MFFVLICLFCFFSWVVVVFGFGLCFFLMVCSGDVEVCLSGDYVEDIVVVFCILLMVIDLFQDDFIYVEVEVDVWVLINDYMFCYWFQFCVNGFSFFIMMQIVLNLLVGYYVFYVNCFLLEVLYDCIVKEFNKVEKLVVWGS